MGSIHNEIKVDQCLFWGEFSPLGLKRKKNVIHQTWIFVEKSAKIARFQGRNLWKLSYLDNIFQYVAKYIFKFKIFFFFSFMNCSQIYLVFLGMIRANVATSQNWSFFYNVDVEYFN